MTTRADCLTKRKTLDSSRRVRDEQARIQREEPCAAVGPRSTISKQSVDSGSSRIPPSVFTTSWPRWCAQILAPCCTSQRRSTNRRHTEPSARAATASLRWTGVDTLRRTAPRQVLSEDPFTIRWTGLHFDVLAGDRLVWRHRVCATDSNVEDVARAWWLHAGGRDLAWRSLRELGPRLEH